MGKIFKAEIFKLFKNKTFFILCIVAMILASSIVFLSSDLSEKMMIDAIGDLSSEEVAMLESMSPKEGQVINPGQMGIHLNSDNPMNPTSREIFYSSFGSGLIEVLIGILIAGVMAKEYMAGTIKNVLAYGVKRRKFYIAKFLVSVVGLSIILLILTGISTIGATILNGWGEEFLVSHLFEIALTVISVVIAASAISAIMLLISIITKSNSGTIGITLGLFVLIPNFIGMLYGGSYEWFDKIFEMTPYYNLAAVTSIYTDSATRLSLMFISFITIIIFLFIGCKVFEKQDIK